MNGFLELRILVLFVNGRSPSDFFMLEEPYIKCKFFLKGNRKSTLRLLPLNINY